MPTSPALVILSRSLLFVQSTKGAAPPANKFNPPVKALLELNTAVLAPNAVFAAE